MKITFLSLIGCLAATISIPAQTKKISSAYTDLNAAKCKTVKQSNAEAGSYQGICAGVGGYKLEVLEGDIRQTINVIAPNRKKFELNLWTDVSSGFSSVGQKAEWRTAASGKKIIPQALIVRFNASDNPEDSSKITSYLVIAKIAANEVCITDILKGKDADNIAARKLADTASAKACKVF